MRRAFLATALALGLATALTAAPSKQKFAFIDLQPKANEKLKEAAANNDLASLPQGMQTFEGMKFKIGPGKIQLGGKLFPQGPAKVAGIKVDRAFAKLHILHATAWGCGSPGDETYVADNTVIGKYVLHYEDKSEETIEIVYGTDVRDWWFSEMDPDVSGAKVAWKGENEASLKSGKGIRLYLSTWKNPKPEKKVATIDFLSTKDTAAAPFCVALSAEEK